MLSKEAFKRMHEFILQWWEGQLSGIKAISTCMINMKSWCIYVMACRVFVWATAPLALLAVMASAFGPEGMTMCVGQAALSVLMLEAANYVQHYGLQRCKLDTGR